MTPSDAKSSERPKPRIFFNPDSKSQRRLLFRILGLLKPYRGQYLRACILTIFAGAIGVFTLAGFIPILNVLFDGESESIEIVEEQEREEERLAEREQRLASLESVPAIGSVLESGGQTYYRTRDRVRAWTSERKQTLYEYLIADKLKGICLLALLMLVATTASASLGAIANMKVARIQIDVLKQLSQKVYAHCLSMDVGFFDRHSTGTLMARTWQNVNALGEPLKIFYTLIKALTSTLFLLIFLFYLNVQLTLIIIVLLPLAVLPSIAFGKKIRDLIRGEIHMDIGFLDLIHETFSGITLVKSFGAEEKEIARYEESSNFMSDRRFQIRRFKELSSSFSEVFTIFGVVAIVVFGALLMFRFNIIENGAQFIMYLLVLNRFYKPLNKLTGLNVQLQKPLVTAGYVFRLLDTQPVVKEPESPEAWPENWNELRFRNVEYRYRTAQGLGPTILDKVNFTIPRNKTTAIVGRNGSGKTTIVSLLARFYRPAAGRIDVGTTRLDRLSSKDLRKRIAFLTQETVLFDMSVEENIAYGPEPIDVDRVRAAAQATHAAEFIEELPSGYQTPVGQRGGNLSSGQRQLIALTRILYRDPEILILDEPETSLDVKYRSVIAEAMREAAADRTTILITHHLPSMIPADRTITVRDHQTFTNETGDFDPDMMLEAKSTTG